MFKKNTTPEKTAELDELERITKKLAELRGEVAALRDEKDRTAEVNRLKTSIEDLRIQEGRIKEEHARSARETEHKVGLLIQRQEQDIANATREAELKVRETNLEEDRKRFKEQIDFQTAAVKSELDRFDDILKALIARLPNIEASLVVTQGKDDGE